MNIERLVTQDIVELLHSSTRGDNRVFEVIITDLKYCSHIRVNSWQLKWSWFETAQCIYSSCMNKYNDFFHPLFATCFVSFLNLQTEWHILNLACRTELVTFAAAWSVEPSGSVTDVDVSDGMLLFARNELSRLKSQESCWENTEFYHHNITWLKELEPIQRKSLMWLLVHLLCFYQIVLT